MKEIKKTDTLKVKLSLRFTEKEYEKICKLALKDFVLPSRFARNVILAALK